MAPCKLCTLGSIGHHPGANPSILATSESCKRPEEYILYILQLMLAELRTTYDIPNRPQLRDLVLLGS